MNEHRISNKCFGCGESISRCALTELCYTFEVCPCDDYQFHGKHLGEAVWHKRCFMEIQEKAGQDDSNNN